MSVCVQWRTSANFAERGQSARFRHERATTLITYVPSPYPGMCSKGQSRLTLPIDFVFHHPLQPLPMNTALHCPHSRGPQPPLQLQLETWSLQVALNRVTSTLIRGTAFEVYCFTYKLKVTVDEGIYNRNLHQYSRNYSMTKIWKRARAAGSRRRGGPFSPWMLLEARAPWTREKSGKKTRLQSSCKMLPIFSLLC